MDLPFTLADLNLAENFLGQGDIESALPLLQDLRDALEAYSAAACRTTDSVQYFSFADAFERLAYRRVENDPRTLVQVPLPFDRVYADLALCYLRQQEYALARDALMQAVRWNPMNGNYRLDLAEVFRVLGDTREWASLSHSVLDRAADPRTAARAYANLGQFFAGEDNLKAAVGCARLAGRMAPTERRVAQLKDRIDEMEGDASAVSDVDAMSELEAQGVPTALNAEIAICLIMCATDAGAAGNTDEATRLIIRARAMVGSDAVKALIQLVRESDAELAAERADASRDEAKGESDAQ